MDTNHSFKIIYYKLKSILILAAGLLICSSALQAQDTLPVPDSLHYEAYYCFAYFEDSLFYAPVFTIEADTSFHKEYLEEQWKAYVRDTLLLDWFLPVVEGPYDDSTNAASDLYDFYTQMPDSVAIFRLPPFIPNYW
jgi:hypothetical protein